jgi:hypothetical protein
MNMYKKIGFLPCLAVLVLNLSCSNFFTNSLASWAQRDPSKLIPPVTTGNVNDLILLTESSPDQSLALLERIAEANTANPSPELQAAALEAATNASGIGSAILQYAGDISSIDTSNAEDIAVAAINSLSNAVEAGAVLASIIPTPDLTPTPGSDWDNFVTTASAEDLAMAALVILAGQAKDSGDTATYISSFPASPTAGSPEALAKALADAARANISGGFGDLLDELL